MLAPYVLLTALPLVLLAVTATQHRNVTNVSSVQQILHGPTEPDNQPPAPEFEPGHAVSKVSDYGGNVAEYTVDEDSPFARRRFKRNTNTTTTGGASLFMPSFKVFIWLFSIGEFIVL